MYSKEICPMLQRKINLWEGKLAILLTFSCKSVGKYKFSTLGTNYSTVLKINVVLRAQLDSYTTLALEPEHLTES